MLDGARAAGLHLAYGCRTGTCGVCRARLLSGTIDYDAYAPPGTVPLGLTAEELAAGHVLLCQARPRSDLRVRTRLARDTQPTSGVLVEGVAPLSTGGQRVALRLFTRSGSVFRSASA